MEINERIREIEKRERLMQTYLLISSVLIAYFSNELLDKIQSIIVPFFVLLLTTAILYIIFVSRTRMYYAVDVFGAMFSILFVILLSSIFALYSGTKVELFGFLVYILIFSFSLISPETNEECDLFVNNVIVENLRKYFGSAREYLGNMSKRCKHIILILIFIIAILASWYYIL